MLAFEFLSSALDAEHNYVSFDTIMDHLHLI